MSLPDGGALGISGVARVLRDAPVSIKKGPADPATDAVTYGPC